MRIVQTWAGDGGAPVGWERHCPLLWSKWEYAPGQYDYAAVEALLAAQGTPCHLQIVVSTFNREPGLVDHTPAFHRRSLTLTAANGRTGAIPNYAAADWQAAYAAAVAALAERYRDHPQVAGYWHSLGLNQETQATARTVDGSDWNAPAAKLLDEEGYYRFIVDSTAAAVRAWGKTPVYVPGAPSPGTTWGRKRRDVVRSALATGARYQMCGLLADNPNATGIGERAGLAMTDIIAATGVRCAFEGGKEGGADAWELYWLLLRAAHWDADFVDLQASWVKHYPTVAPFVPPVGKRWIVLRDAEYPVESWTGSDGKLYGQAGEGGAWGRGLAWVSGGRLSCDKGRFDWARWRLDSDEPVQLRAAGLADGRYLVSLYHPPDVGETLLVDVRAECFSLPAGAYHRVDVHEPAFEPETPTLDGALRAAAEAHDVLAVNPSAALCKAGAARGLWPTSNEFDVDFAGVDYVAQRFRDPHSDTVVVLYCVKGRWETVMAVSY